MFKKQFKYFYLENKILLIITVISSILLFFFSFVTVFNYSCDMEKEYIEGCNSELIEELRDSFKYGKTLDNYYGLNELLVRGCRVIGDDKIIIVEDAEHNIISDSAEENIYPFNTSGYGKVVMDIKYEDDTVAGYLTTYYSKYDILESCKSRAVSSAVGSFIIMIIAISIFSYLLLMLICSQKRALIVIIAGILLQGVFCTFNYSSIFRDSVRKDADGIGLYIEESIKSIEEKGVLLDELDGIDEYLANKTEKYNFIKAITLDKNKINAKKLSDVSVIVEISNAYLIKEVTLMMLSFFATVVLAIIIMIEALPLSDLFFFRKTKLYNTRCFEQNNFAAVTLRLTNFLTSTFSYICLSFSALMIKEWNQGFLFVSPGIASALSISLCTMAEAVGVVLASFMFKKAKKKTVMFVSTVLLIVSNLSCFIVHSSLIIVFMRTLAGFGFAGNKYINNTFITSCYSSDAEKQKNLTESNAGIIGGILCGMGLGSVIADVFNYQTTFLIAGIGYILYLLVSLIYTPWILLEEETESDEEDALQMLKNLSKVLGSLAIWKKLIVIVLPQYIILMIIITLIPGRIQTLSLNGNVLTYANLINGILGLYVGGILGEKLVKKFGRIKVMALVFIAAAVSMFIINLSFPVVMLLLSAAFAGLLDGIGTPLSTDIFLDNKLKSLVDEPTGLMLFSMAGFVVMSIAPILLELCEKNIIVLNVTALVYILFAIIVLKLKEE